MVICEESAAINSPHKGPVMQCFYICFIVKPEKDIEEIIETMKFLDVTLLMWRQCN